MKLDLRKELATNLVKIRSFMQRDFQEDVDDSNVMEEIYISLVERLLPSDKSSDENSYTYDDLYTYDELSRKVGYTHSFEEFKEKRLHFRLLIGRLSAFEVENGRPMISAIVVRGDTKTPGEGFFDLAERELKLASFKTDNDRHIFWCKQITDLQKFWRNKFSSAKSA